MKITKKFFNYLDRLTFQNDMERLDVAINYFLGDGPCYLEQLNRIHEILDIYDQYLYCKKEGLGFNRELAKTF